MNNSQRFKLHYGPYETLLFEYGDVVECARRGEVKIMGITSARIPWPIGKPVDGGNACRLGVLSPWLVDELDGLNQDW